MPGRRTAPPVGGTLGHTPRRRRHRRAPQVPPSPLGRAVMRSVDRWPMASTPSRHSGASQGRYPPPGVTGPRYPPPWACMSQSAAASRPGRHLWRTAPWGTQWGQLDGPTPVCPKLQASSVGAAGAGRPKAPLPLATLPGVRAGSRPAAPPWASPGGQDSYLVDSASSHMLVSKIKPCMCQYKHLYRETANGSLNQLSFI
jgi:hypothetical protein